MGWVWQKQNRLGIEQIIVSTEKHLVVTARSSKLGIPCLQAIEDKAKTIQEFCSEKGISLEAVGFVGNDINDIEAMRIVGTSFCPKDAHKDIRNISTYVMKSKGGDGVVRELFDHISNIKK